MTTSTNRKWESLESCGLILGKVSQHFLNQTRSSLYSNLYYLALNLSHNPPTLLAFYHLLALLALEFAQVPGFHTEGGGPWNPPPSPPSFRKLENLYSLILMHDTVAMPHKLLPTPSHQKILYETLDTVMVIMMT